MCEVRGQGMIIGVALKHAAKPVVEACFRERLIVNGTNERAIAANVIDAAGVPDFLDLVRHEQIR